MLKGNFTMIKKNCYLNKYLILLGILVLIFGAGALYSWKTDVDFQIVEMDNLPTKYEAGTWAFAVSYRNDSAMNYAEIYAPDTMDADGNLGVVYARIELPVEENRVRTEITFDEYTTNVQMRVVEVEGECDITEVSYRRTEKYNDAILLYLIGLLALACVAVLLKKYWENSEKLLIFVGLLLVIFIAMTPYMNSFLPKAHDLDFHLLRIEGVYQGLKDGIFPARINMQQSNGYGYISPIMYPQLLIYIPAVFRLMGMSLLNSYKLLVWAATILTALISYYSFKKILNSSYAGLIGSALYTLGLYRLTNVYCRAAVGEYLAAAFLPLVLYGMYEIVMGNYKKWIWASVGITLVFQQHLLTTEICLAFTLFMCLFGVKYMIKESARIWALCKAAIVTILLNIGTIIPLLFYMREDLYIFSDGRFLPDMVVYLSEVFATFVKMEGRQELRGTTKGEMPLSIGGVLLAVVILFAIYCYRNRKKIAQNEFDEQLKKLGINCIVTGSVAIIMSMWFFPWTMLARVGIIERLVKSLQYLSRFLMVPAFLFCFVGGILISYWIKDYPNRKIFIVISAFIVAIIGCLYSLESMIQYDTYDCREAVAAVNYTDDLYLYNGDTNEVIADMGKRIWVSEDADVTCKNLKRQTGKVEGDLIINSIGEQSYVELPLYYYPQYTVELNGKKMNIEKGENGTIRVYMDETSVSGKLVAYFDTPALWKAGDVISFMSVIAVAVYLVVLRKRKNENIIGEQVSLS